MKDKELYELGILAQNGNDLTMLEIIERKKNILKKYSYDDEDLYQLLVLKIIEGTKKYKF